MKRLVFVAICLALIVVPESVRAQNTTAGDPCFASGVPFAGESLTVSNTALPFTASVYNQLSLGTGSKDAAAALLCVNTNSVNVRSDGTAPTAAIGMPLATNSCVCIGRASFNNGMTRMIRVTSDSVVFIVYIAP